MVNSRHSKIVEGQKEAHSKVREYDKKGGKKKFLSEVEVHSELHDNSIENLVDFEIDIESSREKRLFQILRNHCVKSTPLGDLYRMCVKAQLEWDWVSKRIGLLASQGGVMFPNPWSLKYIIIDTKADKEEKSKVPKRRKDVGEKLRRLFRRTAEPVSEDFVYLRMKEYGFGQNEVETVLNDLIDGGYIIRPRPGLLRFIEDWKN
ncbi:MAG: hypothetical protein ACFE7E_00755 [Candidatus Hodarchaeota archaeon]